MWIGESGGREEGRGGVDGAFEGKEEGGEVGGVFEADGEVWEVFGGLYFFFVLFYVLIFISFVPLCFFLL